MAVNANQTITSITTIKCTKSSRVSCILYIFALLNCNLSVVDYKQGALKEVENNISASILLLCKYLFIVMFN